MKYIIEFEGFQLQSKFIFKEVCVVSIDSDETFTYFLKSPFKFDKLSNKEKRTVRYCENHLHNIFWKAGSDKCSDFLSFLKTLRNTDIVYTKGLQKTNILFALLPVGTQVVNFEDIDNSATIESLSKQIPTDACKLRFHKYSLNCAVLKAQVLKQHLQNESFNGTQHGVSESD